MFLWMSQNPRNLKALIGSSSWVDTTVTQAPLEALCHEYQIYDGVAYGTTAEGVLRMACLDVMPENITNKVMVVFEVQLKCGLRIPPFLFLT